MIEPQNPRLSAAEKTQIGIIILAAGASSRMGEAKQLLRFQGKTLLRRAVETALESIADSVIVVLGAGFERTKEEIQDFPVEIVFNEDWQTGLGSSVRLGVEILLAENEKASACLMMLADQPLITAKHLNLLVEKHLERPNIPIIAAQYENTIGVPAIFSRAVFDDLRKLSGDEGAKKVIKKYGKAVRTVDLPEAAFDVDTPQDFENLRK